MTQNVQFEDSQFHQQTQTAQGSLMTRFLIENKIVKNAQQASFVLIAVAIVLLLLSFFISTHAKIQKEKAATPQPDPTEVINIKG